MASIFDKTSFIKYLLFITLHLTGLFGCSNVSLNIVTQPNVYTFDNDDQGWRVSKGGLGTYNSTGGNPDGYFAATDTANGVWYFLAPKLFIDEVKKRNDKTLHFDLKQSATDSQVNADDVILSDGITTLTLDTAYNPKTIWTSYSVKLDEFSGWRKGKLLATKADVQSILQNLTELRIRGEFRAGPDLGGLDNVTIY